MLKMVDRFYVISLENKLLNPNVSKEYWDGYAKIVTDIQYKNTMRLMRNIKFMKKIWDTS